MLERNKVKVAVIQESKLSSSYKNPCIRNYTTVRKDRPHGHGGGLLIFIHRSITFSKHPSSPETLSDPHLKELSIPPASSCRNGYQSSIEHLTTPDVIILCDFNAQHSSWYSRSTDTRGRKMAYLINGSDYRILNAESSSPDVSLASASLITSCSWQTLLTLSSDHLPILIRLHMETPSKRYTPEPWRYYKVSMFGVCLQCHKSWGELFVQSLFRLFIFEMFWL